MSPHVTSQPSKWECEDWVNLECTSDTAAIHLQGCGAFAASKNIRERSRSTALKKMPTVFRHPAIDQNGRQQKKETEATDRSCDTSRRFCITLSRTKSIQSPSTFALTPDIQGMAAHCDNWKEKITSCLSAPLPQRGNFHHTPLQRP